MGENKIHCVVNSELLDEEKITKETSLGVLLTVTVFNSLGVVESVKGGSSLSREGYETLRQMLTQNQSAFRFNFLQKSGAI